MHLKERNSSVKRAEHFFASVFTISKERVVSSAFQTRLVTRKCVGARGRGLERRPRFGIVLAPEPHPLQQMLS